MSDAHAAHAHPHAPHTHADGSHASHAAHASGATGAGSVMLDLGEGIGALILNAPAGLLGREIEISPVSAPVLAHRTHSMVRQRNTAAGTSYAAVYISVPEGEYTVWRDADTPAGTVTIHGGQISHFTWPSDGPGGGAAGGPAA